MTTSKDRVKELRWVEPQKLTPHERNWRNHPDAQRAALRGIIDELGFADAVIARETPEGLQLIDGHLRREVSIADKTAKIPVLIVDLNDEETDKLLLTLDPLAMMAHSDQDALLGLLESTTFESDSINAMLEALVNGERDPLPPLYETPFLTEALNADEKGLPFPTFDADVETDTDSDGLMNFVLRVTPEQRTTIMTAVNKAKATLEDNPTTTEALVVVCDAFH